MAQEGAPGFAGRTESTSTAPVEDLLAGKTVFLSSPNADPGCEGDVMPELPDRPDLGQLRRQARELLRAAANGEPNAVTRLQAVSDRVMLSAAQLAVAREYGYSSWSTLRAEVERRRLSTLGASPPLRGGEGLGVPAERWSFGGGTAIETGEGVLFPGALVISS